MKLFIAFAVLSLVLCVSGNNWQNVNLKNAATKTKFTNILNKQFLPVINAQNRKSDFVWETLNINSVKTNEVISNLRPNSSSQTVFYTANIYGYAQDLDTAQVEGATLDVEFTCIIVTRYGNKSEPGCTFLGYTESPQLIQLKASKNIKG